MALILVRNFIPCYRKSDERPGYFDTVSRKFFTFSGMYPSDFRKGPNVKGSLPFEYQQVEYLDNHTSGLVINTETYATDKTIIELDFQFDDEDDKGDPIFGCYEGYHYYNSKSVNLVASGSQLEAFFNGTHKLNVKLDFLRHKIRFGANISILDGVTQPVTTPRPGLLTTVPLYLNGSYGTGVTVGAEGGEGKIYSCKIWNEIEGTGNIPFIDFTFGNKTNRDFNIKRISTNDRYQEDLLPKLEFLKNEDSRMGEIIFQKEKKELVIDVPFAFDKMTQTQFNELHTWFLDGIQRLIFDENPIVYYNAKINGAPDINYICFEESGERIYKGEGNLSFIIYDGVGHYIE